VTPVPTAQKEEPWQRSVDIETFGDSSRGALASIGAHIFQFGNAQHTAWNLQDSSNKNFYVNIDLTSSIKEGMVADGKTIMWWTEQGQAARHALQDPKPVHIKLALKQLRDFYDRWKPENLWGHATFDPVVIAEAYRLLGQQTPWGRRDAKDLRTLSLLSTRKNGGTPLPFLVDKSEEQAHNALYDAQVQAVRAVQLVQFLES